jgi:hypothetical protein
MWSVGVNSVICYFYVGRIVKGCIVKRNFVTSTLNLQAHIKIWYYKFIVHIKVWAHLNFNVYYSFNTFQTIDMLIDYFDHKNKSPLHKISWNQIVGLVI